jgi:hypothetical protein
MLEIIQTVLLFFVSVVALIYLIKFGEKKNKKRNKINPNRNISVLTNFILDYMNNSGENIHLLERNFKIISADHLDRVIDLKNYLSDSFVFNSDKMKIFLNELLRYNAEKLNKAYFERDKFYRENDPEKAIRGTLSLDEIQKLIFKKGALDRQKEKKEKDFWFLHDTITNMGFMETYGYISYKVYLGLKPLKASEIFG